MRSRVEVHDARDVRAAMLSPAVFSPANALEAVTPLCRPALKVLARSRFALPPVLATLHSPEHRTRRAALAALFTTERVAAATPRAEALVADALARHGSAAATTAGLDLAATVAAEPPAALMCELFDWPCDDLAQLGAWSDAALELFWGFAGSERQVELATSCAELYTWLTQVAWARPNALTSALAPAGLSRPELLALAFFLGIAGHRTTTYLATNAFARALADPSAWTAADRHPRGIAGWAEEVTRATLATASSVTTWRRLALADTTLPSGQEVRRGDHLVLSLTAHVGSAATEREIRDAATLSFGVGLHRCLGAGLAQMEVATILAGTRTRFPALRRAPSPDPARVELLSFAADRHLHATTRAVTPEPGLGPQQDPARQRRIAAASA